MINIIEIISTNEYIYTPISWLHYFSSQYKVYISFILLVMIPYQKYNYIIIAISIYLIMFLTLLLPKKYYKYFINLLLYILIYILLSSFSKIALKLFHEDTLIFNSHIRNKHYSFRLPIFILRIILITLLNLINTKVLLYTTMYEQILLSILQFIYLQKLLIIEIIFTTIFSYQLLEFVKNYLSIIAISIKTRYSFISIKSLTDQYIFFKFFIFIKNQVYRISSIMYIKSVHIKKFRIYDFNSMN